MTRPSLLSRMAALFAVALCARFTSADVINFETYTGPTLFNGVAQTLTIPGTSSGTVTIKGGEVLTGEVGLPADMTSLYGTCSASLSSACSPFSNTITLTFSSPIKNFFLNLYNGEGYADTFTIADNVGDSIVDSIGPNTSSGNALVSLLAAGTQVTITTTDPAYDFSIDNVGFNQATPGTTPTATPEPGTLLLLSTGVSSLGALGWRRRRQQ